MLQGILLRWNRDHGFQVGDAIRRGCGGRLLDKKGRGSLIVRMWRLLGRGGVRGGWGGSGRRFCLDGEG